ncbi:MAG: ABC transporter substrate-binding protein [Thermomicrobiales bacterium]
MPSTPPAGSFTRRQIGFAAIAGGIGLTVAPLASAQTPDASPGESPAASPVAAQPDPNATFTVVSPTREESLAAIRAAFPFEEPATTGGDIIQAFSSDITMVNPMLAQDVASGYITGHLYESLIGLDPATGTFIPGLADAWELGSDGVRYRFHLNPNAAWHDGTPLTADDVVFSFDIMRDPKGLAPSQGTLDRALASIARIDDHTVELVARDRMATFLNDSAGLVPIMPKHVWGDIPVANWPSDGGTTGLDPARVVGSGAFRFVEWMQGDHITIARNEDYWLPEQVPVIDRYIYRVVADSTTALQAMQTGEADITGLDPAQAPAFIERNPEMTITEFNRAHITYYETNMDEAKTTRFLDVRVRQAMLYALDRDLIAENIYLGYAIRADGPQPPLSPAYAPEEITTIYHYDPEKANALLDEAGWTLGSDGIRAKDGDRFTFDLTYEENSATLSQLITYMQQSWKAIGLEMNAIAMPFPAQQDQINKRDYDVALTGITLDATGNQGIMYRSDSTYPAGYNEVKYGNPEYDRLDDLQQRELDPAKRRALLIEESNILAHDIPMAPLVFANGVIAHNPRVRNFFPTGYSSTWSIPWAWVAD